MCYDANHPVTVERERRLPCDNGVARPRGGTMSDDSRGSTAPRFGGDWTDRKLETLRKYLQAYTTALKWKPTRQTPFKLWYVDAFAGSGHRTERVEEGSSLFEDDADAASLRKGSARLALDVTPPFQRFVFVERKREHCEALERLKTERPDLADRVDVRCGDANDELTNLCSKPWIDRRAVVFLDPFATAVRWHTLEAIAKTRAMDTWILFPLMAVNRMLKKNAEIPEAWGRRIDDVFGTTDWRERMYQRHPGRGLFGQDDVEKVKVEQIGRYFLERLRTIFAAVADKATILTNSTKSPLFMLCFAAASPTGAKTAVKIADSLTKDLA
jgi:three-Cys-motif partner protein